MVVTDLHGDWDAYQRYRDRFVGLQARHQADCLIFTGDLIHSDSSTIPDASLQIILDVLKLQTTYGEAVIYLCGNHELPHIYGFGLSKGNREYTPAFEATLNQSSYRAVVTNLFLVLPFYLRTAAGVSLTHAGAADVLADAGNAFKVFAWNHQKTLSEVNVLLVDKNIDGLRRAYARLSQAESYNTLAKHYLAVTGADDPRYDDLLRGFMVTTSPDFRCMYSALFTKCEQEYGMSEYARVLSILLQHLSVGYVSQQVLVAGHMTIQNGYQIVAEKHLRLASGSHAIPRETGLYLLFDAASPIRTITDLLANLYTVYAA